jgi:hypothetical protein
LNKYIIGVRHEHSSKAAIDGPARYTARLIAGCGARVVRKLKNLLALVTAWQFCRRMTAELRRTAASKCNRQFRQFMAILRGFSEL